MFATAKMRVNQQEAIKKLNHAGIFAKKSVFRNTIPSLIVQKTAVKDGKIKIEARRIIDKII